MEDRRRGCMKYRLLKSQFEIVSQCARRAASDGGREICGLLVSNGYFLHTVLLTNKTKTGGGFSFYCTEVRKVRRACEILHHEIVGTLHSHPAYIAKPSRSDILNAVDDSLMLVFDVIGKRAGLWHVKNHMCVRRTFTQIE